MTQRKDACSDLTGILDINRKDSEMISPTIPDVDSNISVSVTAEENQHSIDPVIHSVTDDDAFHGSASGKFSDITQIPENLKGSLHNVNFLPQDTVLDLLITSKDSLPDVPDGPKDNMYFVINNVKNMQQHSENQGINFSDDCGAWTGTGRVTPKAHFLKTDQNLKRVEFCRDLYGYFKQKNKKTHFIPLDPQPDPNNILVLLRSYSTLKLDEAYRRRISWFGHLPSNMNLAPVAIVEYVRKFLGHTDIDFDNGLDLTEKDPKIEGPSIPLENINNLMNVTAKESKHSDKSGIDSAADNDTSYGSSSSKSLHVAQIPENQKGNLDRSDFLPTDTLLDLLINSKDSLPQIPAGRKDNMYFIVNNAKNIQRHSRRQHRMFSDDYGAWIGFQTPKTYYWKTDLFLKRIEFRDGLYGHIRNEDRESYFIPFDHQPDPNSIIVLHRNYSTLKFDPEYRRRISWFGQIPSNMSLAPVAIVEYVQKFRGCTDIDVDNTPGITGKDPKIDVQSVSLANFNSTAKENKYSAKPGIDSAPDNDTSNDSSSSKFSSHFSQIPKNQIGSLSSGNFLPTETVFDLLTNSKDSLPRIPAGQKDNIYFVVNNAKNMQRRSRNLSFKFPDDCGAWIGTGRSTPQTHFLNMDQHLKSVEVRNGLYGHTKLKNRKSYFIPFDPQPDLNSIVVLHRQYSSLKRNAALKVNLAYRRRISWFGQLSSNMNLAPVAIVEYAGKFPGRALRELSLKQSNDHIQESSATSENIGDKVKQEQNTYVAIDSAPDVTSKGLEIEVHKPSVPQVTPDISISVTTEEDRYFPGPGIDSATDGYSFSGSESRKSSHIMHSPKNLKGSLDGSDFLPTDTVFDLLTTSKNSLPQIPAGMKDNTYFVVNNAKNIQRHSKKQRCRFSDDCGAWLRTCRSAPKTHYLITDQNLKHVHFIKSLYGYYKYKKNKRQFIPLDPQPDPNRIVVLHRKYFTLKLDQSCKRRISWFGQRPSNMKLAPVAIVEYCGIFPGRAPGKRSLKQSSDYIQAPADTIEYIDYMTKQAQDAYITIDSAFDVTGKDLEIDIRKPTISQVTSDISISLRKEENQYSADPGIDSDVDGDTFNGIELSKSSHMYSLKNLKGSLDGGDFLPTDTLFDLLTTSKDSLPRIPAGRKHNTYFVVNNAINMQRRSRKLKCRFSDDCGTWLRTCNSEPRTHYLKTDQNFKLVHFIKGLYGHYKYQNNKSRFIPLDPQPDPNGIVVLHRRYTTLKLDQSCKRRISWFGQLPSNMILTPVAIVEYSGIFPGRAPGKRSLEQSSDYFQAPADTCAIEYIDYMTKQAQDTSITIDSALDVTGKDPEIDIQKPTIPQVTSGISISLRKEKNQYSADPGIDSDADGDTFSEIELSKSSKEVLKGSLDGVDFLPTNTVFDLLTTSKDSLPQIPAGKKDDTYFVVNNAKNIQRRSRKEACIFPDDCGAWLRTCRSETRTHYLKTDQNLKHVLFYKGLYGSYKYMNKKRQFIPFDPQPDPNRIVVLHRKYSTLKLDQSCKRRISWFGQRPRDMKLAPVAVVEYAGKFPCQAPHKRSLKQSSDYIQTCEDTLEEIGDVTKHVQQPKLVYNELDLAIKSIIDEPRSPQQIYNKGSADKNLCNTASTQNFADQIQHIIPQISSHPLVQQIIHLKNMTPSIILYTSEQIQDIKTLCASGRTCLSFDSTFNLGCIFATVGVFKHLSVYQRSTNDHPIFIGPIFLHGHSTEKVYQLFSNALASELKGTDCTKLVLVCNNKTALQNAMQHSFPNSKQVVCMRHLLNSIKQSLQDKINLDTKERNIMIEKLTNLAAADRTIASEESINDLQDWCRDNTPKFLEYLNAHVIPLLQQNLLQTDDPTWTSNSCVSTNDLLKFVTQWKQKSVLELLDLILNQIEIQYKSVKHALIGSGDLVLEDRSYYCNPQIWTTMTEKERHKYLYNFLKGSQPETTRHPQTTSKGKKLIVFSLPNEGKTNWSEEMTMI